jgi:hypothetical protein
MEMENRYASRGVGNAGLTTGIIGTALGALATGVVPNVLGGGGCHCNEDHTVNRYEMSLQQEIAAKDTRISLLESNIYVDSKIADVYERLNTKIGAVEASINAQAVINAQVTANLSCLQNTVNVLSGMTKTIIPIDNICPPPMERYNSWVAPTTTT